MANTLDNITLLANTPTEIYAHSTVTSAGISSGTQLLIQNVGDNELKLHSGTSAPTINSGFKVLPRKAEAVNESGDTKLWITSEKHEGLVNVSVAP